MEKLELKHLATYLPYGLKMDNYYSKKTIELAGLVSGHSSAERFKGTPTLYLYFKDGSTTQINEHYQLTIMPILRPLSDINIKDIEKIDGVKSYFKSINFDGELLFKGFNEQYVWLKDLRNVEEYLFKNHYDVFGLINNGLAIDINNLKQ